MYIEADVFEHRHLLKEFSHLWIFLLHQATFPPSKVNGPLITLMENRKFFLEAAVFVMHLHGVTSP